MMQTTNMQNIWTKMPNETNEQFVFRVCGLKDSSGMTWPQIADIINNALQQNFDESAYRKKYKAFQDGLRICEKQIFTNDEYLNQIREERRELEKERKKLQTEKIEYNKYLREEARDEMIRDAIIDEVRRGHQFEPPTRVFGSSKCDRAACLCIADAHYGTEFKIYGLHGEIINEYSPEIFEIRMQNLFNQVVDIIEKENLEVLHVYSLGDEIDGILRVSQLMKLRYGVIESSVKYANYISTWLNALSQYVYVKFQTTYGNHSELRMLGEKKGTFKDDNTALFIKEIIRTRLENNHNFEIVDNPTGLIFDNLCNLNVLGIHGECKNLANAIKDFSNTYNTMIDILIGGHMHHLKEENIGINRDVISVPSIIGVDDYSMQLRKTSNPGATLFFIEDGHGVTQEYRIKL